MDQPFGENVQAADPCIGRDSQMPRNYDMNDSEADLKRWPNLEPVLNDLKVTVVAAYRTADNAARRSQRIHRILVVFATMFGMCAVLFAILQLAFFNEPYASTFLKLGEAVAAAIALIAVTVGSFAAFSKRWLWRREKAEQYRFLKFWFLIDVKLWSGVTSEARQDWLRARVEQLSTLDKEDLKYWAEEKNEPSEDVPTRVPPDIDKKPLHDLIDYYEEKRICYQRQYFEKQAEHGHSWERFTRIWPTRLFFASIFLAFLHFSYDWVFSESSSQSEPSIFFSVLLVAFAACLPVVGAAVRTLRSAHEFGRNTLRFRAAANKIARLSTNLHGKNGLLARLAVLHKVEKELRAERHEWLRLMIEAEWFG
jgi:hypothetical protein